MSITSGLIIGKHKITNDSKTLIIAEAGINHDGKYEQAIKLINIAKEAGADIVKFQLFKTNKLYTEKAGEFKTAKGDIKSMNEVLREAELSEVWISDLMSYCDQLGIGFLCTACDEDGADVLNANGVDSFKIASSEITHLPLLAHVARFQKTIVLSEAGAYLSDVDVALRTIRAQGNNKIALMHCVYKYPTPIDECNLRVISMYKLAFPDLIVGYSDHTIDPVKAPVTAVICGAKIIEKHFTIDKNLLGADHSYSLNPEELKQMCTAIRRVEELSLEDARIYICGDALGKTSKTLNEIEKGTRDYSYRCIIATKDLYVGDLISNDNIAVLRPGLEERGLDPYMYDILINHHVRVACPIEKGKAIKWDNILSIR